MDVRLGEFEDEERIVRIYAAMRMSMIAMRTMVRTTMITTMMMMMMMTITWKAGTLGSSSASNKVVRRCHTEKMEKMPLRRIMMSLVT